MWNIHIQLLNIYVDLLWNIIFYIFYAVISAVKNLEAIEIKYKNIELTWTYYLCTSKGKNKNFNILLGNKTTGNHTSVTISKTFYISVRIYIMIILFIILFHIIIIIIIIL